MVTGCPNEETGPLDSASCRVYGSSSLTGLATTQPNPALHTVLYCRIKSNPPKFKKKNNKIYSADVIKKELSVRNIAGVLFLFRK
jgi:hypothetical protein